MVIIIMVIITTNNISREDKCDCKTKNKCPMNGLCNLEKVECQGIIFTKENVKST